MTGPALVWFRDDYRLADNPALSAAVESGASLLCFAIIDESSQGLRPIGSAARWWLHGSLHALDRSLRGLGSRLVLFRGPAEGVMRRLAETANPSGVFWNRRYQAAEIAIDSAVKADLSGGGIAVRSFNGRLLHEPWQIQNQAGRPYRVFTPYLRAVAARPITAPLPRPKGLKPGQWPSAALESSVSLADLRLEPTHPDWAAPFSAIWCRGEDGARDRLTEFLEEDLGGYAVRRDFPAAEATSRLSPHLRFGEISPRQIWHAAKMRGDGSESHVAKFLSEVVWRDFCHQQLYDDPDLATAPSDPRFEGFRWADGLTSLIAWQKGRTGYPIVDAGMRQLWQAGWMHNRVRMIVGSFLVKHLLTDWRHGEAWFWDTLLDADAANNAFNWQWIAGSGPDSSPFHRIFNPVTQGEKFDPDGAYIRAYVPELAGLPAPHIHKPWEAPREILQQAGIVPGKTYPLPIVDHAAARERALDAYRALRALQPGSGDSA
ncbi:deoxyribodipyrimidine photo-lyase [Microvirga sp. 17 mud 1-3]|uniref:cryptochrome/photolyase family protein n=1 Tax=Microvirga sp. 17 mud 1-3 TaxID=2082949 RepID=UPI000D6BB16F|nr:deoxyribodipyrimidine photo-lyase [Microvirga sp. 17 mud 1-3]AWM89116.1 deoxyribodipyrimidine photolyase [Microvirga sp. 17 mud 1-3]